MNGAEQKSAVHNEICYKMNGVNGCEYSLFE